MRRHERCAAGKLRRVRDCEKLSECGPGAIYRYRDRDAKVIYVILEGNGRPCPLKIKKTATLDKCIQGNRQVSHLTRTDTVHYMTDKFSVFDSDNLVVPIWLI